MATTCGIRGQFTCPDCLIGYAQLIQIGSEACRSIGIIMESAEVGTFPVGPHFFEFAQQHGVDQGNRRDKQLLLALDRISHTQQRRAAERVSAKEFAELILLVNEILIIGAGLVAAQPLGNVTINYPSISALARLQTCFNTFPYLSRPDHYARHLKAVEALEAGSRGLGREN